MHADTRAPAGSGSEEAVRLVSSESPGPFAAGRETAFARVAGDGLRALDVRHGDHVVLVRRDRAEHGDIAAVLDAEGRAFLWKVYPEGDRLRLTLGRSGTERMTGPNPRVHGVVVAVLRRAPGAPARQSPSS